MEAFPTLNWLFSVRIWLPCTLPGPTLKTLCPQTFNFQLLIVYVFGNQIAKPELSYVRMKFWLYHRQKSVLLHRLF